MIDENDLDRHIRYGQRVTAAGWSTEDRRWFVAVTRVDTGEQLRYTARFLWMCSGYYNHDLPYQPHWQDVERFKGLLVHPQRWPEDLDVTGKRVVVIGSGATAATLIPALADQARQVTMLQRSPTYFFAPPRTDELAETLRALDTPEEWTYEILRRHYTVRSNWLATTSVEAPELVHSFLMDSIRPLLPEGFDVDKHLTPRYRPWQQRIAIVPDGDFFTALRGGKVSIVTDTIERFTERGIRVGCGEEIPADIVVTATGFNLSVLGDIAFDVDGRAVDLTEHVTWRGIMLSGLPNLAYVFGYFRHSWTLRVDLVADLVVRLLAVMRDRGATMVVPTPRPEEAGMRLRPWADPENFNPGYVMRSQHLLFKQGDHEPWTHLLDTSRSARAYPRWTSTTGRSSIGERGAAVQTAAHPDASVETVAFGRRPGAAGRGRDRLPHHAVVLALGSFVVEARALEQAAGAVVDERRRHPFSPGVMRIGLDDSASRPADQRHRSVNGDPGDPLPAPIAVHEDAREAIVGQSYETGLVFLLVIDARKLGGRPQLAPADGDVAIENHRRV